LYLLVIDEYVRPDRIFHVALLVKFEEYEGLICPIHNRYTTKGLLFSHSVKNINKKQMATDIFSENIS